MAESKAVARLPRPLPERVQIISVTPTPNEMLAVKEASGMSLNVLFGGDQEDLDLSPFRMMALSWIQLRRDGYEATWQQVGDMLPPEVVTGEKPDPTSAA